MDVYGFEKIKRVLRDDTDIYPEPLKGEDLPFVHIGHYEGKSPKPKAVDILNALAINGFMAGESASTIPGDPVFEVVGIDDVNDAVTLRDINAIPKTPLVSPVRYSHH
jgi:hypothetical protein